MKKKAEEEAAPFYGFMHQEMLSRFSAWRDEICERERGFRYSELLQIETAIARMHAAAVCGSKEAEDERDRLTTEYIKIWLPRRQAIAK